MNSITEELLYRQKAVKFAIKHNNNAFAARRYHTSRQQIKRWRDVYDGTIDSLRPKSRKPNGHPKQHTDSELELIKKVYGQYKRYGYGEVYAKLMTKGYRRSFGSMKKQILKLQLKDNTVKQKKRINAKKKRDKLEVKFPGQYVQMDIKYVPRECLSFDTKGKRYYQITAIDLYSRKRVLKLVEEQSTYETSKFLRTLEERIGFKIQLIQTDNGTEFVNVHPTSIKDTLFENTLAKLDIEHKLIRPYSAWQNGVVERSHRLDDEFFYQHKEFKNEEELLKSFNRYNTRYNNIHRQVLNFKSPNEIIEEYNMRKAE